MKGGEYCWGGLQPTPKKGYVEEEGPGGGGGGGGGCRDGAYNQHLSCTRGIWLQSSIVTVGMGLVLTKPLHLNNKKTIYPTETSAV